MSRLVTVGLLTRIDPPEEVRHPGYDRGFGFLSILAGHRLGLTNETLVRFPRPVSDWDEPIVGFAIYGVGGESQELLCTGKLNQARRIRAGEMMSFQPGSLRLEVR